MRTSASSPSPSPDILALIARPVEITVFPDPGGPLISTDMPGTTGPFFVSCHNRLGSSIPLCVLYANEGENCAMRRSSEGLRVEKRCLDDVESSSAAVEDLTGDVWDLAATPASSVPFSTTRASAMHCSRSSTCDVGILNSTYQPPTQSSVSLPLTGRQISTRQTIQIGENLESGIGQSRFDGEATLLVRCRYASTWWLTV